MITWFSGDLSLYLEAGFTLWWMKRWISSFVRLVTSESTNEPVSKLLIVHIISNHEMEFIYLGYPDLILLSYVLWNDVPLEQLEYRSPELHYHEFLLHSTFSLGDCILLLYSYKMYMYMHALGWWMTVYLDWVATWTLVVTLYDIISANISIILAVKWYL